MKIVIVKLVTGEEVIGQVVKKKCTDETLVLDKARTLVMQQGDGGQVGLGMMPFMASADNPETETECAVEIDASFIMAKPVEIPKVLEDAYLRTTSKLQLV